jgi:hypothetical protein
MAEAPSAYPLAWPTGRPRARSRQPGRFSTTLRNGPDQKKPKPLTLYEARERLAAELDRLRARSPILSSHVELGVNGQPRSGRPEPSDPGVACYFQLDGKPIVLACDSYTEVAQNIAAIAAHIDAMRRMERYGVATMTQMFTGFLALPAPIVVDDWRATLGEPRTLAEAEASFRERMKTAHPDGGGTHARAATLTAAIALARKELGGTHGNA